MEGTSSTNPPAVSDVAALDSVVVDGTSEEEEYDLSRYWLEFKPGYEYGLLAILVKVAETLQHKTILSSGLKRHNNDAVSSLHTNSTAEDFVWAKNIIRIVHGQHETIPELPTNVSHPCLQGIVACLNRHRHLLLCNALQEKTLLDDSSSFKSKTRLTNTSRSSQEYSMDRGVAHHLTRPKAWWDLDLQIRRGLVRYYHYARSVPQPVYLPSKEGPKAMSKLINHTFPLLASLKVVIYDLGPWKSERSSTTLALAPRKLNKIRTHQCHLQLIG